MRHLCGTYVVHMWYLCGTYVVPRYGTYAVFFDTFGTSSTFGTTSNILRYHFSVLYSFFSCHRTANNPSQNSFWLYIPNTLFRCHNNFSIPSLNTSQFSTVFRCHNIAVLRITEHFSDLNTFKFHTTSRGVGGGMSSEKRPYMEPSSVL